MADNVETTALVIDGSGAAAGAAQVQAAAKKVEDASATIERATKRVNDATASQTRFLDSLTRRYDPAAAAAAKYAKETDRLNGIILAGGKNSQRAAEVLALLKTHQEQASDGVTKLGNSSKFSAYQLQNLTYQLNDVVSGLAMGQKPMQVLTQQGGQFVQIFASMNSPLSVLFGAKGLLIGGSAAAAAGMAVVIARAITLESELRKLSSTSIAYGGTGAGAAGLQSLAITMSQISSATRSESIAALQTLQKVQGISGSTSGKIALTAPSLADATGTDISAAMSSLTASFQKGYEGVKALDDEYNFLSVQQRSHVRALFDQGKATEAWGITLDALRGQMTTAANAAKGPLTDSLRDLSNAVNDFINAIATNPNTKALIDSVTSLTKGGADLLNGTPSNERFVTKGALGYGVAGAITGGTLGLPLGPLGVGLGSMVGGGLGGWSGKNWSQFLQRQGVGVSSVQKPVNYGIDFGPTLPAGVLGSDQYDAMVGTRVDAKKADDLTDSYKKQLTAVSALTPAARDLAEVSNEAAKTYGNEGQEAQKLAYITNELAVRAAQRNAAVAQAAFSDNLQAQAQQKVAAAFQQSESAGYQAQLVEVANANAAAKSTNAALELAAAKAKQQSATAAAIAAAEQENYALDRQAKSAKLAAEAALRGPAAKQAVVDTQAVRDKYEPLIAQANATGDTAGAAGYTALMQDRLRRAEQDRATTQQTWVNSSTFTTEQDIALTQKKIDLIGVESRTANDALAIFQAQQELQRQGIDLNSEQGQQYIENQRRLSAMTDEFERQKGVVNEFGNFFDQAFDRIGSSITQMAVEGQSAFESLSNIGSAVASELMQEFIKLSVMNPLKNAFGLNGGTALPVLGDITSKIGDFLGFASGTPSAPPGMAWVGERGPELVRFRGGEQVYPHDLSNLIASPPTVRGFADGAYALTSISGSSRPANDNPTVNVNIINNAGADVSAKQKTNSSGGIDIDVLVDQSVSKKVGQRGSATNRALRQSFGTSERLIGR